MFPLLPPHRYLIDLQLLRLNSINDLSDIYCELSKPEKALQILEDILPIVERMLGFEQVGMIMAESNLFRAYILIAR